MSTLLTNNDDSDCGSSSSWTELDEEVPEQNIGLVKKKCRICDRNLTLYLTCLELSDLSQICAVLFANLLPIRRQRHYPPLIKPPPYLQKTQTTSFRKPLLRPT